MAIHYKSADLNTVLPTQWADIPQLTPLVFKGAEVFEAFNVTLTLPMIKLLGPPPVGGLISIRLVQDGGTVLSELEWVGNSQIMLYPFLSATGDIVSRGGRVSISAQWRVTNTSLQFKAIGLGYLTVIVDRKAE
ncbi:hypothetical protein LEP1GSC050_0455 [Leptospira broomii serovar Hurstbridge str. 5399]|uniref:Uncharacterized protein n=3 Tax=Leptospira TaxID=171 RepID=V6HA67_9LEPT|nr:MULTISPECIES: hypothetical protein [Leptospira]EQA36007.1 hypothetical protein LEP1GSC047_0246 [Leptospira inadai serovar Lyme str. 10]EQA46451.1 hypothetical protein LEP1GSC050_0455 [Leptospira broomii serovar Hurstbridge str. 5399]PNV76757.1 hypothetical protein BES34_000230 [Leptospira inadai serovar Lyme]